MQAGSWLDTLDTALRDEERASRSEHARQVQLALRDRVAVGLSWAPLRVDRVTPAGRRWVIRLLAPRGVVLHDGIGSGDPVTLGTASTVDGPWGWVLGAEGRVAEVSTSADPDALPNEIAVSLRFDATTFQRYRGALERAAAAPSRLRDVLLGVVAPTEAEAPTPMAAGRLDPVQHAAGCAALSAGEVALVHGPPGTGKTEVVAAMLAALVAAGDRPWALADSNAAVDNLAVRAAERGLRVVRIGHPARVSGAAAALTVDAQVAGGPYAAALSALDRDLGRIRSAKGSRSEHRALIDDRRRVRQQARDAVVSGAEVIACTLGTLARVATDLPPPHTAIVDEATQAIEPAVWAAVPWVQRLVLVGDPHQLGPVVVGRTAALERSLLQRLLDESDLAMPMLEVQHRMDLRLQALVQPVYGERWRAHPAVAVQLLADLPGVQATPLTTRSCLWVDTAGSDAVEAEDPVTHSLYNTGEIAVVQRAVDALCSAGVLPTSIGVIAPYSAQAGRLREVVPDGVEVATVNAFQGRELDAIVCSFVRSNDRGELGFVADGRRLTVALTRARRFLLAVGDSATLASHPRFAELLDGLAERGDLASVFEPPWDEG
ncbi:MAG: ATP-dependent RNA/DNA helicase IGHMBP2 [Myxococcota bacterium]